MSILMYVQLHMNVPATGPTANLTQLRNATSQTTYVNVYIFI
jgi:hypothetical protein